VSYVEMRPVLVCTDEDVVLTARARSCDGEVFIQIVAGPATGSGPAILDVQIQARVWREWARAVQQALRDEERE
jgi:hypothetical protein